MSHTDNKKIHKLSTLEILWIYKNILEISKTRNIETLIDEIVVDDFSIGMLIYEDICKMVLRVFENKDNDYYYEEMSFLSGDMSLKGLSCEEMSPSRETDDKETSYSMFGLDLLKENSDSQCKNIKQNTTDINIKKCKDNTKYINNIKCKDNNINNSQCIDNNKYINKQYKDNNINNKQYKDNNINNFIINNIYTLCKPIIDVCLKHVLDLFVYIYKYTKDFRNIDLLILKYSHKDDILIDLYLLKLKFTSRDFKNIDSKSLDGDLYLNKGNNKLSKGKINERLYLNESDIKLSKGKINERLYLNETDNKFSKDNISASTNNETSSINNTPINNDKTILRDLILNYKGDLNFLLESICSFLKYEKDELLIEKLKFYSESGYRHIIYKHISSTVYSYIKDTLPMCTELLVKGVFDLDEYLNWSFSSFKNLSIVKVNDLIEIAKLYPSYFIFVCNLNGFGLNECNVNGLELNLCNMKSLNANNMKGLIANNMKSLNETDISNSNASNIKDNINNSNIKENLIDQYKRDCMDKMLLILKNLMCCKIPSIEIRVKTILIEQIDQIYDIGLFCGKGDTLEVVKKDGNEIANKDNEIANEYNERTTKRDVKGSANGDVNERTTKRDVKEIANGDVNERTTKRDVKEIANEYNESTLDKNLLTKKTSNFNKEWTIENDFKESVIKTDIIEETNLYIKTLKEYITKFILDCSRNIQLRKLIAKKMNVLNYLSDEHKQLCINNLLNNFNLDWRYRKDLIIGFCKCNLIEQYLGKFKNDKVWYIRNMVEKIEIEIRRRELSRIDVVKGTCIDGKGFVGECKDGGGIVGECKNGGGIVGDEKRVNGYEIKKCKDEICNIDEVKKNISEMYIGDEFGKYIGEKKVCEVENCIDRDNSVEKTYLDVDTKSYNINIELSNDTDMATDTKYSDTLNHTQSLNINDNTINTKDKDQIINTKDKDQIINSYVDIETKEDSNINFDTISDISKIKYTDSKSIGEHSIQENNNSKLNTNKFNLDSSIVDNKILEKNKPFESSASELQNIEKQLENFNLEGAVEKEDHRKVLQKNVKGELFDEKNVNVEKEDHRNVLQRNVKGEPSDAFTKGESSYTSLIEEEQRKVLQSNTIENVEEYHHTMKKDSGNYNYTNVEEGTINESITENTVKATNDQNVTNANINNNRNNTIEDNINVNDYTNRKEIINGKDVTSINDTNRNDISSINGANNKNIHNDTNKNDARTNDILSINSTLNDTNKNDILSINSTSIDTLNTTNNNDTINTNNKIKQDNFETLTGNVKDKIKRFEQQVNKTDKVDDKIVFVNEKEIK